MVSLLLVFATLAVAGIVICDIYKYKTQQRKWGEDR